MVYKTILEVLREKVIFVLKNYRGSNSAVECQLPKLNVAGSIPVSRSSNNKATIRTITRFNSGFCRLNQWLSYYPFSVSLLIWSGIQRMIKILGNK